MANALYQTNQSIPQDMLLGNLLFTNLVDMKISETDLIDIFDNNSIPKSYVRKISKADAFRRASSSIKNNTLFVNNTASGLLEKVHVEIDEIRNDTDSIKRIIGIKKVDQANEDIAYEQVGEIVFNRSNDSCVAMPTVPMSDPDHPSYQNLCDDVMNRYQEWAVYHNKDTVKNIINRIINDTHPINLMPTGLCKFIPASSTDLMYNLRAALGELSKYSKGSASENIMEIIPVIDTDEQRDLVQKNFTAEITDELFAFTQELKDMIKNKGSLSTRSANAYIEKFKTLRSKAQEYESLLGIYVGAIHQQIVEALDLVDDSSEGDV